MCIYTYIHITKHIYKYIAAVVARLSLHSLVDERRHLAAASRGGDHVAPLTGSVALLVFGQKVEHLVVVHLHHRHLHRVVVVRLLRDQPGSGRKQKAEQSSNPCDSQVTQILEHINADQLPTDWTQWVRVPLQKAATTQRS